MSLTKEHIINSIYNHLDFPKRISIDLVESLLEIIKKTLGERRRRVDIWFWKILCERET